MCASLTFMLNQEHFFGTFSDYFMEIMKSFEEDQTETFIRTLCDQLPIKTIFKRLSLETGLPKIKTDYLNFFSLICLCRVAQIEFIHEEGIIDGVRNCLNTFLKSDPSEDKLRAILVLMEDLLMKKWDTKFDIISLFFDCIYKRINTPFFMPNSRLDTLTIIE